jgi:hypothetical protein
VGQVRTARAKSRPIRPSPTYPHWAKPSQIISSHSGQFVPIPRGNHVSIIIRPPLHQHIPRHSQAKSARDLTQPNPTQIRSDWTRLDAAKVFSPRLRSTRRSSSSSSGSGIDTYIQTPSLNVYVCKRSKKRPSHSGTSPHAMQCKTRRVCTRLVQNLCTFGDLTEKNVTPSELWSCDVM